jgi:hypothetical protein
VPAQAVPVADTPEFHRLQVAVAGKRVRVVHADWRQEEIVGARLEQDGVLRRSADSTGVPIEALSTIQVRTSSAGHVARIGGVIGGLVFLAGGIAASQDESGLVTVGTGTVALMTAAGVVGGALTGALLGAPFSRWKTVYRAPGTVRPTVAFGDRGVRLGASVSF